MILKEEEEERMVRGEEEDLKVKGLNWLFATVSVCV